MTAYRRQLAWTTPVVEEDAGGEEVGDVVVVGGDMRRLREGTATEEASH